MSAIIIPFPTKRRAEFVEVERCSDPANGRPLYVFEVVTHDDRRVGIGMRHSLEEARDDIRWFRHGGVAVVEIGSLEGAA